MSIDYGNGKTNIDVKTGIRYGVISQHSINMDVMDKLEPEYGDPTCPDCGRTAQTLDQYPGFDFDTPQWTPAKYECNEYVCPDCHTVFGGESAFGDPTCECYNDDGYAIETTCNGEIMVFESLYWTWSTYCSPCIPGAGDLDTPGHDCRAYCLGPDWFDDGIAPYTVYRVSDNSIVK